MIYFITDKKAKYDKLINTNLYDNITILYGHEGLELYHKTLHGKKEVYLDIEASDLDAYEANLLLTGVRVKNSYFMFDHTIDTYSIVEPLTTKYVIGHNLKYDIKILKVNSGILLKRMYDTMIAEQRLFMGAGYRFGYDELVLRYENKIVLKDTRDDFIGKNPDSFVIQAKHLVYLYKDLEHLSSIKKKQQENIHRSKMQFLIYGIECALIPVVANAELRGFKLDTEKWLKRVNRELAERREILDNLDGIVRELRELPGVQRDLLVGGKWDKPRIRNEVFDKVTPDGMTEILDLFGEPTSTITLFKKGKPSVNAKRVTKAIPKLEEYPGCIKYTKQEIVHIFGALNQSAITEMETFSVPKFLSSGKLQDFNKYSIKSDILDRYLVLKPNSIMAPFLNEFGKLQTINKSLSTYGKSFIAKINKHTGRIHSAFGQGFTDTGRMNSGGGKNDKDKFNNQNIPRDLEMRQAFGTDDDKDIDTADYSGAELILMVSFAQDFKLLELSAGDMHSHFATIAWREVFRIRATQVNKLFAVGNELTDEEREKYKQQYADLIQKSETFTVTKDFPKGYRTNHKPITFGIIYGAFAKKVAQILNISILEAQGVIRTVEREIPVTIAMVKAQSNFAERHGYLIHNTRTNSRRWFPALIKQIKGEYDKNKNFMDISEALSAARNSKIQGTQADFIKEASVKLQYFYWKNNFDANILAWVHDEIVDEMDSSISKYLSFVKKEILTTTANKYLTNVEISVENSLLPYWTK